MKIFCIFLTFFFTVSCGPSVLQRKTREKTREIEERRGQCYLVRGTCKASCNIWEYVFNYCGVEPCCVVREYIKPMRSTSTTSTTLTRASVNNNSTVLPNATVNYNILHNTTGVNNNSTK
ncbi:beta-defensin 113 [Camelus ferus]|uniref:Beta-defensin 113 n=1 Tax=Camelus ferus TaxID=419612 RepID=A0A8B8RMS3_CAMFR|nr:beta-defensin 113 [Camelus ferus]